MKLIPKGTKLYSILHMKCPKCHESDLFTNKNLYQIQGFFDMPKTCPNCGQRFELEPAFYYGAMYVSYAVGVAWFVSVFVALFVLYPSYSIELYLAISIGGMLALTPVFFKLSRAIWINLFVHYHPETKKEQPKELATK